MTKPFQSAPRIRCPQCPEYVLLSAIEFHQLIAHPKVLPANVNYAARQVRQYGEEIASRSEQNSNTTEQNSNTRRRS